MGDAMSSNAALGFAWESTFGAGPASGITEWLQATAVSGTTKQDDDVQMPLVGDSEVQDLVPGPRQDGGGIEVPAYGGTGFDALLKAVSRDSSSAQLAFRHAAAPTITPGSGGSIPDGTYYLKAAPVVRCTATGRLYRTNWSAESTQTTAGTGNNTFAVAWTNPSGSDLLPGFTHAGTIIAITATGGSTGTEKILHYVSGTGTGYSITSIAALSTITADSSAIYSHSFLPGTTQPPSFALEVINDNGASKQYWGCKMGDLNLTIKPGEREKAQFNFFARESKKLASPSTPSPSLVKAYHGKDAVLYVQTQAGSLTQNTLGNSFTLQLSNKLERKYNCLGPGVGEFVRTIKAKMREIKGGCEFDFENTAMQDYMLSKQPMDIRIYCFGPPTDGDGIFTESGTTIYPWPYMKEIHIPNFTYQDHDANPNTENPITEKLGFIAAKDPTATYALRIRTFNTATSV